MKYEWKKQEHALYLPDEAPALITVPRQKFFAIKGKGDPNRADFSDRIGVLYSLSYAVRMMPKSGVTPDGYFEYTVYPLEGVWENCDASDKSEYVYTIMIRQPEFVTAEVFGMAMEITKRKKPQPLLDEVFMCEMEDGLSVQMMHIGDYDDEHISFAKMQAFLEANGLVRRTDDHREIYLSDVNKVERDKLKTVLRYCVDRK